MTDSITWMKKEGHFTLKEVKSIAKIFDQGLSFSDLSFETYTKLDNFLHISEEMPYGTQKARTGDPDEWIYDKLEGIF